MIESATDRNRSLSAKGFPMSFRTPDPAELRGLIGTSTRIAVLSGAGISAASGVPTFRGGEDSLWEDSRPEELATPQAFAADPRKVWRWYDWRRGLIAGCRPNAAHAALAELEKLTAGVTIITQNVDGLHADAGSSDVLEFHGSIWKLRCTGCGAEAEDRRVPLPIPPRCPDCGGMQRPGVVWFGEGIDPEVMHRSLRAAASCDLFLIIGTSGVVFPAAGLGRTAAQAGARVIEFNIEPAAAAWVADYVAGSADLTVPMLLPGRD